MSITLILRVNLYSNCATQRLSIALMNLNVDWFHKIPHNVVRGLIKLLYRICNPLLILFVL